MSPNFWSPQRARRVLVYLPRLLVLLLLLANPIGLPASMAQAAIVRQVADINFSRYSRYRSGASNLTAVNGWLFFTAYDHASGRELWTSDGSEAGTVRVADINPGIVSSMPSELTDVQGTLFFSATNGITGVELWKVIVSPFQAYLPLITR